MTAICMLITAASVVVASLGGVADATVALTDATALVTGNSRTWQWRRS